MTEFEKIKASVHESIVNLDDGNKAMLVASCSLYDVEVEKLEDTIATVILGVKVSMKGLLEKNTKYLSK